ncbi:hypothetical protein MYP_3359 [Sporocytophaga myxococcoides]|uniref:Fibronectin type-III domain-containing protein n=2 Tax=Sporocytophaga myxococcoides TaxID=153721 RepID=A0A098LGN3_9BACT|nr:hypothetical protein MYP_3359 [Sporocytophaga myxococcoides]
MVGTEGRILRSVDSGRKWQVVYNDPKFRTFYSLFFFDSKTGYAGGEEGLLLKTIDGGINWDIIPTNIGGLAYFNKLHFNGLKGNAVIGSSISYTEDGGLNWIFKSVCEGCGDFTFPEPLFGYNGNCYTYDGGVTWTPTFRSYSNSVFITKDIGFRTSSGVSRTRDGGITWIREGNPITIDDAWFMDSLNGYGISRNLGFFSTSDAGRNWASLNNPNDINNIDVIKYGHGIAFAYDSECKNLLRLENDKAEIVFGQITSLNVPNPEGNSINVNVTPDSSVFVSRGSYIYKLNKGEQKWTKNSVSSYILDMFFIDKDTGYLASHILYKTIDGGKTWNSSKTIDAQTIFFTDAQTGYYGHETGYQIGRTSNYGASWSVQYVTSGGSGIRSIFFPDASTGYMASTNGKISKCTNGISWVGQTTGVSATLNDIYFVDANRGVVVGNSGTLLTTTNGGSQWNKVQVPTTVNLNSVYFANKEIGYVVGNTGTVLVTFDSGETWEIYPLPLLDNLYSVYFYNGLGYIAGENNLVLELNHILKPSGELPSVVTTHVLQDGETSVNVEGNITDDGGNIIISRGFCWSTSPDPTINDNKTTVGAGLGSFSSLLENLTPNVTYYLRAYATNGIGTSYGNEISFSTATNTGLYKNFIGNNITIYPNPGNGKIKLDIKSLDLSYFEIKLMNVNGVIVYSKEVYKHSDTYNGTLDLELLPSGIYTIQIVGENNVYSDKLIISK